MVIYFMRQIQLVNATKVEKTQPKLVLAGLRKNIDFCSMKKII